MKALVALAFLLSFTASAAVSRKPSSDSDKCRGKALEAAEMKYGKTATETFVKTIDAGSKYFVAVREKGEADEKIYDVVFSGSCANNPTVTDKEGAGDDEDDNNSFLEDTAYGNRCTAHQKYHNGNCCDVRADGSLDCPKRENKHLHDWRRKH